MLLLAQSKFNIDKCCNICRSSPGSDSSGPTTKGRLKREEFSPAFNLTASRNFREFQLMISEGLNNYVYIYLKIKMKQTKKPPEHFCFHEADPKCFQPYQNMKGKENSWEKLPSGGGFRSPSWVPTWPASGVQLSPGYKGGQDGTKSVKVSQRPIGASTRNHNHCLLEHVDTRESFSFLACFSTYLFVWSQFHFEKHRKRARTLYETERMLLPEWTGL